jgi:hypothetical protein
VRLDSLRRLRRARIFLDLPVEIITGLLIICVAAAATVILSPSPHHPHVTAAAVTPPAGGGGAFVGTTAPTTTSTVAPTTTTAPPTTQPPPPPTTQAPAPPPRVTTTTAPPPPPARTSAAVGVYAGGINPGGAAGFARDTGAHVTVVEDYLPGGAWTTIDGAGGSLGWLFNAWRGTGYQLVLGVPMFDNSGTDSLAAGATGAYNQYFVILAQQLVASGEGNAILRLGQEFTTGNPWEVTDLADAQNYANYFRQIVTAMRTVDPWLRFIWEGADPEDGAHPGAYTADDAYPGDAYVNYIGTDTYDQSWVGSCGLPFNNTATAAESDCSWAANTLPGLTRVADFASAHDKPVVFPEWGLAIRGDGHGLGDDPTFIHNMAAWMAGHDVAFDDYFNFDVPGQVDAITDGNFPASLAAYRAGFG